MTAVLGWTLVVGSWLLWLPLPALPLLPVSAVVKSALGAALFVAAELTFWVGVALVGRRALRSAARWLSLWRPAWLSLPGMARF